LHRHVFQSIAAGIASWPVVSLALLLRAGEAAKVMEEVVRRQLEASGAPPGVVEEAVRSVAPTISLSITLAPLGALLQGALIGALLGLLYSWLADRGVGQRVAAAVTGGFGALVLGALPLLAMILSQPWVYAPLVDLVLPLVLGGWGLYTALLILFTLPGPWRRLGEARPSEY